MERDVFLLTELNKRADDRAGRALLSSVEALLEMAIDVSRGVVKYLPEYTLHDEMHIFGVLDLMGRLIPREVVDRLGRLEIASLVLSGAFHDVGMCPTKAEVDDLLASGSKRSPERVRYEAFRQGFANLLRRQEELRSENRTYEVQEIEAYLLAEFLRQNHAERSRDFIFTHAEERANLRGPAIRWSVVGSLRES